MIGSLKSAVLLAAIAAVALVAAGSAVAAPRAESKVVAADALVGTQPDTATAARKLVAPAKRALPARFGRVNRAKVTRSLLHHGGSGWYQWNGYTIYTYHHGPYYGTTCGAPAPGSVCSIWQLYLWNGSEAVFYGYLGTYDDDWSSPAGFFCGPQRNQWWQAFDPASCSWQDINLIYSILRY